MIYLEGDPPLNRQSRVRSSLFLPLPPNMPTIPLHIKPLDAPVQRESPLPQLLHTPSGLAILEIQGTINLPPALPNETATPVGRLVFPFYNKDDQSNSSNWQKTVHLYVGKHQRLTGEVKKLPNPLAVIRKRATNSDSEELEIAEIVHYKIIFSHRPEPVSD